MTVPATTRTAATTGEPERAGIGLVLVGLGGLAIRVFAGSGGLLRVRQHVPPVLIVGAAVCASAILAIAVAAHAPWWAMLPALVGLGAVAALLDDEHVLRVRTAGVGAVSARSGLLLAAAAGQLVGAAVVVLVGGRLGSVEASVVAIALGVTGLTVLALVLDRSSLGALRHQVQQFSWNARPDPRPFEPPPPGTRPARLAGWLQRQVELELVDVTLPVSGRRYAIARPSGDGRDELFEQAKADPERQMPYWAKVWPSGVALADLVVERGDEVRGRQVLELGAGLGVTACAVLEEGGELITADYSLLPLAMCRLNGLVNTGRAPGSICFNWRDERQVSEVLRRHPPIGLVLAADVLYEYRDIQPLIDVIERLLAPGGSLWLAEPVRATAQRFLGKVAEAGWSIDSRRIRAEWPDATDGWVNIHVIRRDEGPADAALALGGWQL
jgi:predicted nicotinamide N-methyase